jgi:receptor protein-tyrosine kinase
MATDPSHLVERLAGRLRGIGGLAATEPVQARPLVPPEPAPPEPTPHPDADGRAGAANAAAVPDPPVVLDSQPPPAPVVGPQSTGVEAAGSVPTGAVNFPTGQSFEMRSRQSVGLAESRDVGPLVEPYTLDLNALERAGLVVGRKLRTRISEEFRITVGTILRSIKSTYTPGRGAGNLLMVTSARPGEGKSFTALNLAGSIAQHTQREVLLVDVDAKQQSLSDLLGVGERPGLIDLATTPSIRIEDYILNTAIANLFVLPVGIRRTESGESAEGTVARPITAMIERLGRRFPNHLIILDAPPCLSTSDPSTLATFVGQIVLVVEAEKTQRAEILASLDLLKACPTVTLLLNKIRVTTSYTFGAYHYFGSYS